MPVITNPYRHAAGGVEPLLDIVESAFRAVSVRLLRSAYTGPCVRVRRTSDDLEADIGFANGWVDEEALIAHCGASDGLITIWYDQSGNNYDVPVTVEGPRIVQSGSVLTGNGRPAIFRNGGTLQGPYGPTISYPTLVATVGGWDSIAHISMANYPRFLVVSGLFTLQNGSLLFTNYSVVDGQQENILWHVNGANSKIRINGAEEANGDAGNNAPPAGVFLFRNGGASMYQQEFIHYNRDMTSDFATIENNQLEAFN